MLSPTPSSRPYSWRSLLFFTSLASIIGVLLWSAIPPKKNPSLAQKKEVKLHTKDTVSDQTFVVNQDETHQRETSNDQNEMSEGLVSSQSTTRQINPIRSDHSQSDSTMLEVPEERAVWVKRTRLYEVPPALHQRGSFQFKPFDGVSAHVQPLKKLTLRSAIGNFYEGKLYDDDGGEVGVAEITWTERDVVDTQDPQEEKARGYFGRFSFHKGAHKGETFELHHHPDGRVSISEVDDSKLPFDLPIEVDRAELSRSELSRSELSHSESNDSSSPPLAMGDEGITGDVNDDILAADDGEGVLVAADPLTQVSVLLIGSQRAVNSSGGEDAFNARIAQAINLANTAYINSEIQMQLVLTHQSIINNAQASFNNVLFGIQRTSDNYFDEIHTTREQHQADIVIVIDQLSDRNRFCGLGFIGPFKRFMFSVTDWQCTGNQTVAHEVGHNMGSHHDVANASPGQEPAYGHHFGTFRTIMAYSPGTRTNHFSNPNVLFSGIATGTNTRNNALIHNNNANEVAAYFGGDLSLTVVVQNQLGDPIEGATLSGSFGTQLTDVNGEHTFLDLADGAAYQMSVALNDYSFNPETINDQLTEDQVIHFTGSRTPQMNPVEAVQFNRGDAYVINVSATDADNDQLTFNVSTTPDVPFTIQPSPKSAVITFDPPVELESFVVTISATDAVGSSSIDVPVSLSNLPPVIADLAPQELSHNLAQPTIQLNASDPNGDPITFNIETTREESVEFYELMQTYALTYLPAEYNRYSLQEHVFQTGRARVIMLPTGEVYLWRGNLRRSRSLGDFSVLFYQHPELFTKEIPPIPGGLTATISPTGLISLTKIDSFTGIVSFTIQVTDGALSTTDDVELLISNIAPSLAEIPDQSIHIGPQTLDVQLNAQDVDGDVITIQTSVKGVDALAYELDQEYDFTVNTRRFNRLRLQEHQFFSRRRLFILLPDGSLRQWNRSLRENSPLIAQLTPNFYEDPSLLVDVALPGPAPVNVVVNGNTSLTLDPEDDFLGPVWVSVEASDGVNRTSRSFTFRTTNSAPVLDPIPDQSTHVHTPSTIIQLQANDPDGDPLTFSVEGISENQVVFDLQQTYASLKKLKLNAGLTSMTVSTHLNRLIKRDRLKKLRPL